MSANEANSTENDDACLIFPEKVKCTSLSFVLHKIIERRLSWLRIIYVESYSRRDPEEIFFPDGYVVSAQDVSIKCLETCSFRNAFFFYSAKKEGHFSLTFENALFINTDIVVQNLILHFHNVSFFDTLLSDKAGRPGEFSALSLWFSNVLYDWSLDLTQREKGIRLQNTFSLHISLKDSVIVNTEILIQATNHWLSANNINFSKSKLDIKTGTTVAHIAKSHFENGTTKVQKGVLVKVSAKILVFDIIDSELRNAHGGIHLKKEHSGRQAAWIQARIVRCIFENQQKPGSGGGVEITYNISTSAVTNFVNIISSTFVANTVYREGFQPSCGGAIAAESFRTVGTYVQLRIKIISSVFTSNMAEDGGGAIYVSNHNVLHISNSSFSIDNVKYVSTRALSILTNSVTFIQNCVIEFISQNHLASLIELRMLSPEDFVGILQVTFFCSPWHKFSYSEAVRISSVTGGNALQKFVAHCTNCPQSYYIPTDGIFQVFYADNDSLVRVGESSLTHEFSDLQCVDCPFGGDCPGDVLKAKPHFWGYLKGKQIVFQACPIGYCCPGSLNFPCVTYNQCHGNRDGPLCGACQPGHSVSLLSQTCLEDALCNASWLWFLAVLASVMYMLWYTLKDDILGFPTYLYGACTKQEGKARNEAVDKAYFGILNFFVQAASLLRLTLHKEKVYVVETVAQQIEKYVSFLLSIELSYISYDVCLYEGITTTEKFLLKLVFFVSIYLSWCVAIALFFLITKGGNIFLKNFSSKFDLIHALKLRLIRGIVEIIKYTYEGFASTSFLSLACVLVESKRVWLYDGTVQCLSNWQNSMLIFCTIYVIPFPFMLSVGLDMLKQKLISSPTFLLGCVIPLPFLVYWRILRHKKKKLSSVKVFTVKQKSKDFNRTSKEVTSVRDEIVRGFRGAYMAGEKSEDWESVMIMRRLLLSATVLISNTILQMSLCGILCTSFLIHHLLVKPFRNHVSNYVEMFALFLLIVVTLINLVRATFIQIGVNPDGPNVVVLRFAAWIEHWFVVVLILFILALEVKQSCK